MADVERDFLELLRFFNKHKVRYLIVGAFAVGFHAIPRYTKDMDILVEPSLDNGKRICHALKDFGFGSLKISPVDFSSRGRWIQLGFEPVRVDLITSIKGVDFHAAWENRRKGLYGTEAVFFIGLNDLIRNKRSTGRRQDLVDLEILRKVQKRKARKHR